MSKFVTYPAVTVLDNGHSLLIDDPNAGTNSITAENAGNALLSKWAGFETFDEAVQNTIEHNQAFIDRDTAIRSEIAELKKKIVTTFPAKDASGQIATFESEFEDAPLKSCIVRVEPVQDLHGYDSPWPAGGGKNKLEKIVSSPQTTYGITFTPLDDGTVRVRGTSTSTSFTTTLSFALPAGTYTASCNATAGDAITGMQINGINVAKKGKNVTFEHGGGNVSVRCRVSSGVTVNEVWSCQIEEGSTATDYAPYSNECPITGWTGCEVQRTGKNLFDSSTLLRGAYSDADFNIPSSSSAIYRSIKIFLKAGTYTLSTSVNVDVVRVLIDGGFSSSTYGNLRNHTFTSNTDGYVGFTVRRYDRGDWDSATTLQIELGSTATPYEPYTGQTYPITFPSEAGTIYGGHIDPINGELVVDRVEVADLGTLLWFYGATAKPPRFAAQLPYSGKNDPWWVTDAMLSTGEYTLGSNVGQDGVDKKYGISTKIIYFTNAEYTNAADFKASITGTQVVYRIATPIHYPITPTEIKTLLGQNNIWSNTGDTSVEYLMSDVSWYVKKKLRAFQSILAGVEDSTSASKNYSANTYLIFNNDIYRVTKAITAGETIEEGVNVTKTTVAEQLMALAQA